MCKDPYIGFHCFNLVIYILVRVFRVYTYQLQLLCSSFVFLRMMKAVLMVSFWFQKDFVYCGSLSPGPVSNSKPLRNPKKAVSSCYFWTKQFKKVLVVWLGKVLEPSENSFEEVFWATLGIFGFIEWEVSRFDTDIYFSQRMHRFSHYISFW